MRYALVESSVVTNVIEWDGEEEWTRPEGSTLIESDSASPGDTYDGTSFTTPVPAPVPPTPDVHLFEDSSLKWFVETLGKPQGPIRANTIYAKYPLFLRALDKSDWGDARGLLEVALGLGDISQTEHDELSSLMTTAGIP